MKVANSDRRNSICKNRFTQTIRAASRAATAVAVGLFLFSCLGCKSPFEIRNNLRRAGYPDKLFEGYRDAVWARRAYNLRYGNCNIANCEDFENGFIEGYCDVCDGGAGHAPAVPPNEYWGGKYQTDPGSKMVDAWYRGYPEGVRAARQDGATRHGKMYMSKEMMAALQMEKKSKSTLTAEDFQKQNANGNFPDPTQANRQSPVLISNPGMPRSVPANWNPAYNN